jgi:hypothetical protein
MERRNRHRRLLSPRRKRPCRRTADQRDELAPLDHSITSSAIASRSGYLPSAIGPAENSGSGCRQAPNTSLVAELDELGRNPEHSIREGSALQPGDVDINAALLSDRLDRSREIGVAHQVLIAHPADGCPGHLGQIEDQRDYVQRAQQTQ